jgi:hypothetical protein
LYLKLGCSPPFHTFSNSLIILLFNAGYSYLVTALLTFKRPAFAYANAPKNPPKINFMYSGNKEIYSIFKTCCIICFPQNAIYFIILSFSVQIIIMFFINHVLKFKYQPSQINVQ